MKRYLASFAALCAALTVIAGCGGGATPSPPTPTRPAVATTTQSAMGQNAPAGWGAPAPPSTRLFAVAPSSTATMYDSVDISTIPSDPFAAAGYTAGFWPTFSSLRSLWPSAHTVSVAISAGYRADCLDVEPGDATPSEAPGWVRADKQAGWSKPCLYSDWYEWTTGLDPALEHAGIALTSVYRWVASYVGTPQLLAGYDADQYTDHCLGRNLDCSLVLRSFLSIAHPPLRPPAPKPSPSKRLAELDALLGAYNRKTNPHGHSCADPPYKHPWPGPQYDHACSVWAHERAVILRTR